MTNLNDVKLIGRIVKDSVLEQTAEHKYAKFAIAVNRDVKTPNGEWVSTPTYIDLAIFDNYAEKMYKWLRKGTLVLVPILIFISNIFLISAPFKSMMFLSFHAEG